MADDIIYSNTVDQGVWRVEVERTGGYTARLVITEVATDTIVHTEPVGLMYGAIFGPDIDDVSDWQAKAIDAIDNPEKRSIDE